MERKKIYRILDANFNRLREGLRVLEEAERLGKNKEKTFRQLKRLRHAVKACLTCFPQKELLAARDSSGDVGRVGATDTELSRTSLDDILCANFKRCEEAARVLEEFSKLVNPEASGMAKRLRFQLYTMEKEYAL